jgi:CRP-like cAMP-binding protein
MADMVTELLNGIIEKGQAKLYKRGEHVLEAGAIERHLYVIRSGLVRAYYLNEFEEHTIRFGYQGSIINSLHSYLSEQPSELYLEVLKNTELVAIRKTVLYEHLKEQQLFETYTKVLEDLAIQQIERELDLLTHSPFERYQRVLKRSPHLFNEAPAKYIASYLRMTPETLSRVRNT